MGQEQNIVALIFENHRVGNMKKSHIYFFYA